MGDPFKSAQGISIDFAGNFVGLKFKINIVTEDVEIVRDVTRNLCITAVSLGALYLGYRLLRPQIETAVREGLGGERDDQEVRDVKPGSLHAELHCFTEERFLEVLTDYESGKMKERLQKEFSQVGIRVKELKVEIENIIEVNETKETIKKRSYNKSATKRTSFSHPTTHANMKTKRVSQKNIDEISIREMINVFELLNIDLDEDNLNLNGMKEKAKEKIKELSSIGRTGFSLVSEAKDDDMSKRNKLDDIYSKVNDCLNDMDHNVISTLNPYFNDRHILEVLGEQKNRLKKRDYNLLVAGESSAGKSSLINLILGEDLLPSHVLNTTSTICELKYGEERKFVVHYLYDIDQKQKKPPEQFLLKTEKESRKSYQEQIAPFVQFDRLEKESGSKLTEKVEIFWPHELLENGVVIIDSPGFGESDHMDQVLMNYLPNAFAFIYVIDISRAGGLQQYNNEKLMKNVQLLESGSKNCKNLAECALFVCNKWDLVGEVQRHAVKRYIFQTLSQCWPVPNLNDQIVYMSVTDSIKAQQFGVTNSDFNYLLQRIQQIILRAINTRLYNHWKWLDFALYHILKITNWYNCGIQLTRQETRIRMDAIKTQIAEIEKKEKEIKEDMEARLKHQTNFYFSILDQYIRSPEFETKFCTWTVSQLPMSYEKWDETKSHILKAIEYRFKAFLIEWENENQICAKNHEQLVQEFLERLTLLENELKGVMAKTHGAEYDIDDSNTKSSLSMPAKILVKAALPVWVPVDVVSLIISMPVLGVVALSETVGKKVKLDKYQKDPTAYLEKLCKKFLGSLTEDDVYKYAEWQMEKTTEVLTNYVSSISTLLATKRRIVSKLSRETRSQSVVMQKYTPIEEKSLEIQRNMIPLGIKLCPATVDARDLNWKEDMDSCVGKGEFSCVYRGKLKNGGRITKLDQNHLFDVAVKVFKQPFDYPNSRLYLNEEMEIRHLDHKNVVKFFGAVKVNISYQDKELKFVFVTTFCQANLRNVIFNDKSVTPAQASNTRQAIGKFLNWAMQIADGLNYIHERGLVHRHLKLENILMSEDGKAMITDIGILGRFKTTEKSIIYLAPEVLADMKRQRKEADIYSYGIALWEMWHGVQAFTELMPLKNTTFQEKVAGGYRPVVESETTIVSPAIENIMKSCWHSDPGKRYSAKKCYESFTDIWKRQNVTGDTPDEYLTHF